MVLFHGLLITCNTISDTKKSKDIKE